jgi:uncharacterized protein
VPLVDWDYALIILFFAVAVPLLGRWRIRQLLESPNFSSIDRLRLYASTITFQWLVSLILLWRIHARGLSPEEFGMALPRPNLSVAAGVGLSLFLLINQILSLNRLSNRPPDPQAVLPRLAWKIFPETGGERLVYFAVVATVSVCEEWIYRGFLERIFENLTAGLLVGGILLSAALFGLAHLYQGRRGVLITGVLGMLFSVVREWTGSLLPTMVAHFVADLTVGLLAPKRIALAAKADVVEQNPARETRARQ